MRQKAILALASAALLLGGSAFAAEKGSGHGSGHGSGPCKADMEKFCKGVEKGEGRIIKCMREHKDELSQGCKDKMKQRLERREKRHEAHESKGSEAEKDTD